MHEHGFTHKPTLIAHNRYATVNDTKWHALVGPNPKRLGLIVSHDNATPIAICLGDPGSTGPPAGIYISGYDRLVLSRADFGAAIEQPVYVYDTEAGGNVLTDEIIAP